MLETTAGAVKQETKSVQNYNVNVHFVGDQVTVHKQETIKH